MEKYHAYLDECGGYGFHDSVLEQERMFIVAAAIIKESDIEVVNSALNSRCKKNNQLFASIVFFWKRMIIIGIILVKNDNNNSCF